MYHFSTFSPIEIEETIISDICTGPKKFMAAFGTWHYLSSFEGSTRYQVLPTSKNKVFGPVLQITKIMVSSISMGLRTGTKPELYHFSAFGTGTKSNRN